METFRALTVDLGIFFSNLLDLSNLRVLSLSVSNGGRGADQRPLPEQFEPIPARGLGDPELLGVRPDGDGGGLLDGLGHLVQEPGVELF